MRTRTGAVSVATSINNISYINNSILKDTNIDCIHRDVAKRTKNINIRSCSSNSVSTDTDIHRTHSNVAKQIKNSSS